ncbi:hypothetical protein O3884_03500 [Gemella sp. 20925_1_85]|uniref:hypothetical protein n=1 Tax=Gemella sp. 20925_1_85 TaxID=3003690 RepID=UPI00352D6307
MGECYQWVNVDKKEYISPVDFGYGSKRWQTLHAENIFLCALYKLLATDWAGDHIIWLGDELPRLNSSDNVSLEILYQDTLESGYPASSEDTVDEMYTNISGTFKEAEEEVRDELEYYLSLIKQYGIRVDDPFKGFFSREGRDYLYTINHTKKVYFSLDITKVLYLNGSECDFANPLPILLGYGKSCNTGNWVGDEISTSDKIPKDYVLLTEIYLDW